MKLADTKLESSVDQISQSVAYLIKYGKNL